MAEPITWSGIAALAISNIGMWIREWRKSKNGAGELKALEKSLEETNGKIDNLIGKFEKTTETINAMNTAQVEDKVRTEYIVGKVTEHCKDIKIFSSKLSEYEIRRAELVGWGEKEIKTLNGRISTLEKKCP